MVVKRKSQKSGPSKIDLIFKSLLNKVKGFVLSTQGFPITLTLTILCILFVLFRMKGIEQDYQYSNITKQIDNVEIDGKELKAKKAQLLSVKNLREIAQKHQMHEPKQGQIIVIP